MQKNGNRKVPIFVSSRYHHNDVNNVMIKKFPLRFWIAQLALIAVVSCGGGGSSNDSRVPDPVQPTRTDLLFAYFGDCEGAGCYSQITHANTMFVPAFGSDGKTQIDNLFQLA